MNAKRIFLTLVLAALVLPAVAQKPERPPKDNRRSRDITSIVSDLTPSQLKSLDDITDASRKRVKALRAQQKAVRDSIAVYMHLDGDQSHHLFPLFDREAQLQRDISREMYTTKVRIDEVLTPDQRRQLAAQRGDKPNRDKSKKKRM